MLKSVIIKPVILPYWLAMLVFLVLFFLPMPFLTQLQPDNRAEVFFPKDAPVRQLEIELRKQFPEDDVLIVLFSDKDTVLYSDSFLTEFETLIKKLNENPLIEKVITVSTMDHIMGTEDGFAVEHILTVEDTPNASIAERKKKVLSDRFAPRRIVSPDGQYLALIIRPETLKNSYDSENIEHEARRLIKELGLSKQLVAVAGNIEIEVAMFDMMLGDNAKFVPATILLGIILLWWLFRKVIVIVLVMCTIGAGINSALLFVVWYGAPFSMPVSMVTPLLTSLTIAFFIHFFNSFLQASSYGLCGKERILKVLNDIERPVRYTALTTVAGFLSLGLSPLPPIKTFGFAAAFGLTILYFLVIWVMPAILLHWDRAQWSIKDSGLVKLDRLLILVARISIRHAGLVVAIIAGLLLLGLPQVFKVEAETDLLLYFPEQHALIQSDNLISKHLAGTTPLEIIIDGKERDSLKDPALLKEIKQLQNWVEGLPQVDTTLSMVDIIEEMHWAFHGENPAYRVLPDSRNVISQYFFIYDGRDLFDLVESEFQRTRLQLSLNVHGARQIRSVMNKIKDYLNQEHSNLNWQFAGAARLFSDHEKLLIEGQIKSAIGAFFIIFICLLVFWQRLFPAVLALVPNIFPILLIFIVMGFWGIKLDIGTAIVLSVAIGVAVDDTIHIYDSYLRRVDKGVEPVLALLRAYRGAGRAIFATTLILCGQFFFLVFSSFVPTYQFGLMTGIGLLSAFVFDIMLLPALLALVIRKNRLSGNRFGKTISH